MWGMHLTSNVVPYPLNHKNASFYKIHWNADIIKIKLVFFSLTVTVRLHNPEMEGILGNNLGVKLSYKGLLQHRK